MQLGRVALFLMLISW